MSLETFFDQHQHTVAALSAWATTLGVLISLQASWRARRDSRPQLEANVTIMKVIYPGRAPISDAPAYVVLRLTNVGKVPIRLQATCFSWRLPFSKGGWLAQPMDQEGDRHIPARRYPLTLMPNTSEIMYLSQIERFERDTPRILQRRKMPAGVTARLLRANVYTDDGSLFPVAIDGPIRECLRKLVAAGSAAKKQKAPA